MRRTLEAGLPGLGLTLNDKQLDQLCAFGEKLIEKNQVMNLTGIHFQNQREIRRNPPRWRSCTFWIP